MDWYVLFKFLHVTSAVIWIGGAFIMIMLGVKADRAKDDAEIVGVVRQVAWAADRIYVPASIATLVFGPQAPFHFSVVWLALLPVVAWCFRDEWSGMHRALLDALKSRRGYPEPDRGPGALP